MYATIIQVRDWLPDPLGGVVWLALDNVATSIYVPVYCGVTDLPKSYKTPGRVNGYTRESAWWAFNRLGTLTAQRWGDMRQDVAAKWGPMQKEIFEAQKNLEDQLLPKYRNDPKKMHKELTAFSMHWADRAVTEAWKLGDFLWTKYDEKF
jgi:dipeptidase